MFWNLPGGKAEKKDQRRPRRTALREVLEETGDLFEGELAQGMDFHRNFLRIFIEIFSEFSSEFSLEFFVAFFNFHIRIDNSRKLVSVFPIFIFTVCFS
jgi:8-oxo-dGTP pyrophosphatase MutT (NUDIX family)